jgi:hypothetical protein
VLALCACALGHACGHAARKGARLAPAGSPADDGTGVLARLSAGAAAGVREPERGRPTERPGDDEAGHDGQAGDGAARRAGGTADRAGTYGGSRYANYRFDRSPRPHAAPLPYGARYVPVQPGEVGSVEGTVLWPDPPRIPEVPDRCAARPGPPWPGGASAAAAGPSAGSRGGPAARAALVGARGAVPDAVVYLEEVPTGRPLLGRMNSSYPNPTKHMQVGGVVEWRACRFHPAVQVTAPVGSVLSLTSADEAVQISATRVDGRSRDRLWSVPLGAPGAVHEQLLDRDGFVELRAERDGRVATGWVVVAPHPYFALTDERGRFSLDEVPPGTYTLVVWHAPVVVGHTPAGEPIARASPPVRRKVAVAARHAAHVVVRLPPAH